MSSWPQVLVTPRTGGVEPARNVRRASSIKKDDGKYRGKKKYQSTMPSNPTVTTVKCRILVSRMLTRAFVTAGVRDATAGMHNIRDRVRGTAHLRRSRRAENRDIMAVGMKGEDGVECESDVPYREAVARQVGHHHLANASRSGSAAARNLLTFSLQPACGTSDLLFPRKDSCVRACTISLK